MSEKKNIKRNLNRQSASKRPFTQGAGFGGRIFFPRGNMTPYEKWLYAKGIY
jgi:hypothetical protein